MGSYFDNPSQTLGNIVCGILLPTLILFLIWVLVVPIIPPNKLFDLLPDSMIPVRISLLSMMAFISFVILLLGLFLFIESYNYLFPSNADITEFPSIQDISSSKDSESIEEFGEIIDTESESEYDEYS
eukprot:TRINITY_DN2099_c0_g1_i2.p1 TRINITY_DN2099_c0_g1~~TRINITY_DN2099_c0_g1_i2.p1  ORF type:complete len:143 (+),score=35.32 TRINITY_DN2099_c0_g1_i2:48-431(+)